MAPSRLLAYIVGVAAAVDAAERYGSYPIAPNGLMPRYFLDKAAPLEKRDGQCGKDRHSCLDIGLGEQCCDNESYCYINESGDLRCCPIGSNCTQDSKCKSDAYFCTKTSTASGTMTTQEGCCNRQCPQTSHYLCPSSLGGNCCAYGFDCQSGGNCVETQTASKSAVLTPVVAGCTTSQFKCEDGSGCCNNWQHCTQVSHTGYCAYGNPSETNIAIVDKPSSSGLSSGAKAGIAIGVVLAVGLILGIAAWICILKRRQRHRRASHHSTSASRPTEEGPVTEATDVASPHIRQQFGAGLTQDYFGPNSVAGPYTEPAIPTDAASPPPARAVPSQPQGPSDIAAPVEIDSHKKREPENEPWGPASAASQYATPPTHTIEGRFELYGSESLAPQPSPSLIPTPITPRSEGARTPLS